MTYQPLAYADADSTGDMRTDCRIVRLGMRRREPLAVPRRTLEDDSRRTTTPDIRVSEDAARLAQALHLHLD